MAIAHFSNEQPMHKHHRAWLQCLWQKGSDSGVCLQIILSILADRQQSGKDVKAPVTADDVLQKLRNTDTPPSAEAASQLKEWKMNTPAYKALTEDGKEESATKGKKAAPKRK